MPAPKQLRCFCSRRPLLATYGLDDKNKLYIHVRIFKQSRIYGEVIVQDGTVSLHCRECLRWHTVTIVKQDKAVLVENTCPVPIEDQTSGAATLASDGHDELR